MNKKNKGKKKKERNERDISLFSFIYLLLTFSSFHLIFPSLFRPLQLRSSPHYPYIFFFALYQNYNGCVHIYYQPLRSGMSLLSCFITICFHFLYFPPPLPPSPPPLCSLGFRFLSFVFLNKCLFFSFNIPISSKTLVTASSSGSLHITNYSLTIHLSHPFTVYEVRYLTNF